jgi:hypothetical protein
MPTALIDYDRPTGLGLTDTTLLRRVSNRQISRILQFETPDPFHLTPFTRGPHHTSEAVTRSRLCLILLPVALRQLISDLIGMI